MQFTNTCRRWLHLDITVHAIHEYVQTLATPWHHRLCNSRICIRIETLDTWQHRSCNYKYVRELASYILSLLTLTWLGSAFVNRSEVGRKTVLTVDTGWEILHKKNRKSILGHVLFFSLFLVTFFFFTKPTRARGKKQNVHREKKRTGWVFQTTWPTNDTPNSLCWAWWFFFFFLVLISKWWYGKTASSGSHHES